MGSVEDQNKALARRYYGDIMNGGRLDVIDELTTPDFFFSIPTHPHPFHGPQGLKDEVTMLHGAFPDVHIEVELLLAEGDQVVGHWTGTGTHTGGPLPTKAGDIPPSGRSFRIDGMTWLRMKDGKIVESLANEDTLGLLMQLGVIPTPNGVPPQTTPQENRAIVARYFDEVMNEGDFSVIDQIIAPNFAFRIPTLPEPIRGPDGFRAFVTGLRDAFPDIHFTVEREVADGDKVACRWTITATHKGTFLGVPPTGNHVTDQGIDIFTIGNSKIVEIFVNENDFGLMQQLGAIPS